MQTKVGIRVEKYRKITDGKLDEQNQKTFIPTTIKVFEGTHR